ncbi:hypothetical protein LZ30DRAFT_787423 [Colletotrichum cereale]|nr:hypothetical protein LZ30DRAFT_787423 [Colletotrichum cereale]
MPEDIRDQIYAEEQQHAERQRKTNAPSTGTCPPINITNIAGPRDVAVRTYCEWQCSQVESETLKLEFWKAYNVALDHGLDLEQVHEDQQPDFFVEQGVIVGIARRFIRDIGRWVQQYSVV